MESHSSSNKRLKILGAAIAAIGLVIVGVVALGNANGATPVMPLERAQALAKVENANVPMSLVPDESEVHVPHGWEVESDEPVEGPGSEETEDDDTHDEESKAEEDEDIDSVMDVEEDENGQKYVAELGEDVLTDGAEDSDDELDAKKGAVVAEDGIRPKRCRHKLKKCGYRKRCVKRCKKRCKPYAVRKCKAKKYCKCFCKYYGKIKAARRCVVYKRRRCTTALTYKCRRGCTKYCRRTPRCYCCAMRHITRRCRQLCRYISYKTKCGKCRCRIRKCIKRCRFVCRRYRKY